MILGSLYEQRWEFETLLDELKTHQRGSRVVLRSKLPEGVRQELYGYLCVHFAIRWLMHSVALGLDADPDRMSFTRALRVARMATTVARLLMFSRRQQGLGARAGAEDATA